MYGIRRNPDTGLWEADDTGAGDLSVGTLPPPAPTSVIPETPPEGFTRTVLRGKQPEPVVAPEPLQESDTTRPQVKESGLIAALRNRLPQTTETAERPAPRSLVQRIGLDKAFTRDNYVNKMLPAAAIIESILTKGRTPGSTAIGQMKMISDQEAARQGREVTAEELRGKSLERGTKEKFNAEAVAVMDSNDPPDVKDRRLMALYKKYKPEEALKLSARSTGGGGGTIEWQINKLLSENEGMTWDEAFRRVKVPSTQYGPSPAKLEGTRNEAEQRKLGGLTPGVTQAEIDQQSAIETALRSGKVRTAADLKILLDQIELGTKETERAQILSEEKKKESGSVTNIVASAEALLNNQPDVIGGGIAGGLKRGVAAGKQAVTGESSAAKAHDQLMEANVSLAAKRITMQAGTLSDQDMERAKKLLPMSSDPIETYKAKLDFLKKIEDPSLTPADKKTAMSAIYNRLYGGTTETKKDPWE